MMNILDLIMIVVVLICYIAAFSKQTQKAIAGNNMITKTEIFEFSGTKDKCQKAKNDSFFKKMG